MKEQSSFSRRQTNLECYVSSLTGSLNLEFSNVFHRPLSQDLFQKIRLETINYLLKNGVKVTYPPCYQYTFVKIFYETPEEENKAFFLMEGIKNIITKNAEKKTITKQTCVSLLTD